MIPRYHLCAVAALAVFGAEVRASALPAQTISLAPLMEKDDQTEELCIENPFPKSAQLKEIIKDCGCVQSLSILTHDPIAPEKYAAVRANLRLKDRNRIHTTLACKWVDSAGTQMLSKVSLEGTVIPLFTISLPPHRKIYVLGEDSDLAVRVSTASGQRPIVTSDRGKLVLVREDSGIYEYQIRELPTEGTGFFEGKLTVEIAGLTKENQFAWGVRHPNIVEAKLILGLVKSGEPNDVQFTLKGLPEEIADISTQDASIEIKSVKTDFQCGNTLVRLKVEMKTKGNSDSFFVVMTRAVKPNNRILVPFSAIVI